MKVYAVNVRTGQKNYKHTYNTAMVTCVVCMTLNGELEKCVLCVPFISFPSCDMNSEKHSFLLCAFVSLNSSI